MDIIKKNHILKFFSNLDELYQYTVEDFIARANQAIKTKGFFNIALSGGKTPKKFFDLLSSDQNKKRLDWNKIRFFFVDERYVPYDDSKSHFGLAQENLFSKIGIDSKNIFPIPTQFKDPEEAVNTYEKILSQFPLDLIYLGIGEHGHTASIFPGADLIKKYRQDPEKIPSVSFMHNPAIKPDRITLTPKAINQAPVVIFLASGGEKASTVKSVLSDTFEPEKYPAQLIKSHAGETFWFLDENIAAEIITKEGQQYAKPFTLLIDIGASYLKMMIVDAKNRPVTDYCREATPTPSTFSSVMTIMRKLAKALHHPFERISVGFPGVVQNGVVITGPNMDPSWIGVNLNKELEQQLGAAARVGNDADVQGYGYIAGKGLEMVITLGTGMGASLYINGHLVPNLELGHHPFYDNHTYEEYLGKEGLAKNGIEQWRADLKKAILLWKKIFNYDVLYLGGGNAQKINFELPKDVKIPVNIEGILGGAKLWEFEKNK